MGEREIWYLGANVTAASWDRGVCIDSSLFTEDKGLSTKLCEEDMGRDGSCEFELRITSLYVLAEARVALLTFFCPGFDVFGGPQSTTTSKLLSSICPPLGSRVGGRVYLAFNFCFLLPLKSERGEDLAIITGLLPRAGRLLSTEACSCDCLAVLLQSVDHE